MDPWVERDGVFELIFATFGRTIRSFIPDPEALGLDLPW